MQVPNVISVEGFERQGHEYQKFHIRLEDADLEVFRKLAGVDDDELLMGAFPITEAQHEQILRHILNEVRSRDLQLFLAFGE